MALVPGLRTVVLPLKVEFAPFTLVATRVFVPLRKVTTPAGGLGCPVGTWILVPYPCSWPNVGCTLVRVTLVMKVVTFTTVCAVACPACTLACAFHMSHQEAWN